MKIIYTIILILGLITQSIAQVPQGIPYQAVARDGIGQPLDNQAVKVRFSILDSVVAGPVVYAETHSVTTSALGLFTANVGMGTVTSGSFTNINWGQNFKFLKVELDTAGSGTNYLNLGTQQMLSVPYAFYSGSSSNATNGLPSGGTQGQSLTICNGVPTWTTAGQCPPPYPNGSVFCSSGPTAVLDVLNPTTGKTWMDRNLGAIQVATSSTDSIAFGDLYQWGRRSDGHQCRNSLTTTALSSTDQPPHGNYILTSIAPSDWRSPQNVNLWQGVNGVNNPCPSGYRIPTDAELNAERLSWSQSNSVGAFASTLKLPLTGARSSGNGSIGQVGSIGFYWSSTISNTDSRYLNFFSGGAAIFTVMRAVGNSVRCLKDVPPPAGSINTFGCATATNSGTLTQGVAASGVSSSVPYTGGNGGTHNGQTVSSTGVTGLTATLAAGSFASGAGSLTYTITGTPTTSGTATFALNIGGQSCTLSRTVIVAPGTYPNGSVFCASGPTTVVDVLNPATGKTWMDRNLGATQVATSSTDANSYGDLYQWGRISDGHQCRTSTTNSTLSSTDQPANSNFIIAPFTPCDWRSPQNSNLWQGVNSVNNPCPGGYRLPTETELNAERLSWSVNTGTGAFASPLKLPLPGFRLFGSGGFSGMGADGYYWSSMVSGTSSRYLFFNSSSSYMLTYYRAYGLSVRCIKD